METALTHQDLSSGSSEWKPSDVELEFLKWATGDSEDEIRRRVFDVRPKAYKIFPYGFINGLVYVKLMMRTTAVYHTVLEQARSSPRNEVPKLVEIGCFMGTQLRKLLMDGYPSDHSKPSLIGSDLRGEFIDLGYELFQDGPSSGRATPISLYQADIFDDTSKLYSLKGQIRYIFTGSVFHIFDLDTQTELARRLVDLLDLPADTLGSDSTKSREYIIFGTQQGSQIITEMDEQYTPKTDGKVKVTKERESGVTAVHPETWRKMFESVITAKYEAEWMRTHVRLEARLAEPLQVTPDFAYIELGWSAHFTI